jgi:hypothetical protein
LIRNVSETTKDLKEHQQLIFYEAIGNMISLENNLKKNILCQAINGRKKYPMELNIK